MVLVAFLLVCVCLIILGATAAKPINWVVVGLAVLAMLLYVLNGTNVLK